MPENNDNKKDMNPGQRPVQQPDKSKQGGMGQDKDKMGQQQPGQQQGGRQGQDKDLDDDDKTTQRNPRQGNDPNPR